MSTVTDAAFQLVREYPGGALSLAPRIGKNPTTLSHEVRRTGTAKLGLEDAVAMSVLSGDLRVLNAFAGECDCLVLPVPTGIEGDVSTMQSVAVLARQFGEMVTKVTEAAADGRITTNELAKVHATWSALVGAGQGLVSHLQALHDAGLPSAVAGGRK